MPLDLRWRVSPSATCLHAVRCRFVGIAAAEAALGAALDGPADALVRAIGNMNWPLEPMLEQLAAYASDLDNNQELVNRALSRLRLTTAGLPITFVAGAIADLEAALRVQQPQLAEELPLRMRPLREQWEARGPGLLEEVARQTHPGVVPVSAEVVLVAPYAGGHGFAYPQSNRITFEALLVNPDPGLPETVRLAWLLAQLNSDLPLLTDAMPAVRATAIAPLAMLPAVLAAAEAVELVRCDQATIAHALATWRLPEASTAAAAERIWTWWNTWLERDTPWPVAVAALDAMMRAA